MLNRINSSPLLISALISFAVAAVIAVAVYLTGPAPIFHDTASITRMPVPGTADVDLPAGNLGLYFGNLNAPTGKVMRVPRLDITLSPPAGQPDPVFTSIPPKADVYVDGFHTVQVANIAVTAPGLYHVYVESHEENGGSFSIGQLPTFITSGQNVLRAMPFIGLFAALGFGLGIAAIRARLRGTKRFEST